MLNAGAELTTGAAGMYGSALKFDGQNDYLLIPDDDLFDFGANDFTLSIWVNKHETSVNNTNIGAINKWVTGSDPGDYEWHLGIGQGGNSDRPTFVFESGIDRYRVDAENDISLNEWHHVVALREGLYLRLYVDGQLEDEENVGTAAINNAGLDMQIGYLRTNHFSNASFDNIHIYNRALSAPEVGQLYNLKSNITQDEAPTRMIAESQFGKYYRYGYQGEFAEEDGETGWNSFELREYDAVVGRWTSTDPAGQYASPYIGMGNNPLVGIDPDGAWVKGAGLWTNLFKSDSRIYAEQYASSWSSDLVDYVAYKAGDVWGVMSIDKMTSGGSGGWYADRYMSFTSVDSDGNLGGTSGDFISSYIGPSPGNIEFDAVTQLTLGFAAVNVGVTVGTRMLSVGRSTGRAMFWSGMRSATAGEFAASSGFTTLEMTSAGSFLNATQRAVLPIFRGSLWRSTSARFAAGASGDVFMLGGNSIRTGSVWMQVERQILINNSRVTGIHFLGL